MHRILFVCHGNICRSPMAEFVMKDVVARHGLSDSYEIASCATSTEEIGNDIYPPVKDVLNRHGIPYQRRSARRMTSDDYRRYDMIIAMDRWNLRNMERFTDGDPDGKVSLMMSHAGIDSDVDDPWYTGDFDRTYREISKACNCLLEEIEGSSIGSHQVF